ncbi:MAG: hypothetical protein GKR99_02220 [Rhodobacteraceae bacterium]|nr:hypothetical protein [Paracoccaceae bacterium]
MRAGNKIVSVNGVPVDSIGDIQKVVTATAPIDTEGSIAVELGVEDQLGKTAIVRSLDLPVVENLALLNGVQFQSRLENGEWVTRVKASPGTKPDEFQNGDAVVSYMTTNEAIQGRQGLHALMRREIANGTSNFNFAVNRDGAMWLVTMYYNSAVVN